MVRIVAWGTLVCVAGCASSKPLQVAIEADPQPARVAEESVAAAWEVKADDAEASRLRRPPPAPPPPAPDPRAPFLAAMAEAQRAAGPGDLEVALRGGARLAEVLGGEERLEAHRQLSRLLLRSGDAVKADAEARAWLEACGPEQVDTCRRSALAALLQVSRLQGSAAERLKPEIQSRQSAEQCAAQVERARRRQPCLAEAERTAQAFKDDYLAARVALSQAMAENNDSRREVLLARAERRCTKVQCAGIRRRALAALVALALAKEDLASALRHALVDLGVHVQTLPPALRLWGRTAELERVCDKVDAARGKGACRKAEREATGGWTFRDFSQNAKPKGEGLGAEAVREVGEHYAPLMEECFVEQARRLVPPAVVEYQLRWVVLNDGRVGSVEVAHEQLETAFSKCLRSQFQAWRYPRYEGEWQNVEQAFAVSAVERRRR